MAKGKIAKKEKNLSELMVVFTFANGVVIKGEISEFSEEIQNELMLHGLAQKLGDSYAGAESVEQALINCKDTLQSLIDGKWNAGGMRSNIWAEALDRVTNCGLEEALDKIKSLSESDLKAFKQHPQILAAKLAIEAERKIAAADAAGKAATNQPFTLEDF